MHFQSRYKESWNKIRDGGYKLRLDAIPFQSAKASAEILSDVSNQIYTPCYYHILLFSQWLRNLFLTFLTELSIIVDILSN